MNNSYNAHLLIFAATAFPVLAELDPDVRVEKDQPYIQYDSTPLLTSQVTLTGAYQGLPSGDMNFQVSPDTGF